MRPWVMKAIRALVILLGVVAVALFAGRAVDSLRGPPLEPWHTFVPKELSIAELDRADWPAYLAAEQRLFDSVRTQVTDKLPPRDRVASDRYFADSPIYPGRFAQDFNRSFVLEPDGPVKGVAVLLHGLTDSPYSLRHVARRYAASGFVALSIRLPGHGTVPGGLTVAEWPDWLAATRLAMREAKRRAGPDLPIQLVGYSNGAALALKYSLDALDTPELPRADKLVLVSPMVGITPFARFAGLAGLPAVLPPFAKAAWLNLLPEFNPFKYNSFPVKAAQESFRLTQVLQDAIRAHLRDGRLEGLPPVLAFQSILDHTVSTRAVIDTLFAALPANGSELVLFDVNRNSTFAPFLSADADTALSRLLPPAPRTFRTAVIANISPATAEAEERLSDAGASGETRRPLGLSYPREIYSLSHIALPFPLEDGLYGLRPDPAEDFGIQLGTMAPHGEYGGLDVGVDMLLRVSSNPFVPYMLERIGAGLPAATPR
ncbi:MAG TPA: alpha/beta hydrolase [Xanthobacteraceae bacterium]|jgi:alpha-beta hydrolase superfamily lysophospholipase|nr:alpha/beta hydrolase [Xanthobacteraceae bacterium]